MSFTFDPYKVASADVTKAEDVLMTNPTALQELESYWRSLPQVGGVPRRKDVDPSSMGLLLEDSFILERVAPGVARVRVAGRNLGKLIGAEPRGLPMTSFVVPESRTAVSKYLEMAFNGPHIVELQLTSPRAVGQPKLHGKVLLLPLRDDHGHVTRVLGVLVMSGRRGVGARRFMIADDTDPRVEKVVGLHAVKTTPHQRRVPETAGFGHPETRKTKDFPALRLVVSNP